MASSLAPPHTFIVSLVQILHSFSLFSLYFLLSPSPSLPSYILFLLPFSLSPPPRLHEFVWHGSDPSNPGRFVPRTAKFTKLHHLPTQFQCNVKDVRTNDDTLVTVKLMIFYQLEDIENMVSTHCAVHVHPSKLMHYSETSA